MTKMINVGVLVHDKKQNLTGSVMSVWKDVAYVLCEDEVAHEYATANLEPVVADDNINHPHRYTKGKVECIDAIEAAVSDLKGIEAFCTGNVIKYAWRWKEKEQVDSLKKAEWYLKHLIKKVEENAANQPVK